MSDSRATPRPPRAALAMNSKIEKSMTTKRRSRGIFPLGLANHLPPSGCAWPSQPRSRCAGDQYGIGKESHSSIM